MSQRRHSRDYVNEQLDGCALIAVVPAALHADELLSQGSIAELSSNRQKTG
jgi:hypothetical protein